MANVINLVQVPVVDTSGNTISLYNAASRVRLIRVQPWQNGAPDATPEDPS